VSVVVYSAVLASAFLHALWNALLKRHEDPEIAGAGMFLVCAGCGAIAAVATAGRAFPSLAPAVYSAVAGGFEAIYMLALSRALARAPLGPVYTVSRGGALALVWPLSMLIFGERLTATAASGSLLVAAGLAATGLAARGPGRRAGAAGLALAGLAAACISGYHLCYKQALSLGAAPEAVFAVSLGLAGPLNALTLARDARRRLGATLRARPWPIVIAGLLSAASFLVFLFALEHGGAASVLTLRNTSILFAQVMSWAIGEPPTRLGAIGAVAVTGGAILLGL
jgi:drug/metabolite transporter (DMT)-like permease